MTKKFLAVGVVYDELTPEVISMLHRDLLALLQDYDVVVISQSDGVKEAAAMVMVKTLPYLCMTNTYLCYTMEAETELIPDFVELILHRCHSREVKEGSIDLDKNNRVIFDRDSVPRYMRRSTERPPPNPYGQPNYMLVRMWGGGGQGGGLGA